MRYDTTWPFLASVTSPMPPVAFWPPVTSGPLAASYCSHRDSTGLVVFDPIFFGVHWDRGDVQAMTACLAVKRQLGLMDVVIAVQGGYGTYLGGATFDWRDTPATLHALAAWLLDCGFRPVIYVCTADLGTEIEIYDGTMQRVCAALTDLVDHAFYSIGWEVNHDRGGAFTAGQSSDALLVCRAALGERARLVWHGQPTRTTPASYYGSDPNYKPHSTTPLRWVGPTDNGAWVDADDPSDGNEMGAFYVAGFQEIDIIAYQTDHGGNGPSYGTDGYPGLDEFQQPRWHARALECLDRFLPPGTPQPGAASFRWRDEAGHIHVHAGVVGQPDSQGYVAPDWFAAARRRGRVTWWLLETVPYEYIRDQCCDEAVRQCTTEAAAFGCQQQGCRQ